MSKKRLLFLINPISGVGKKNTIPPLIQSHLNLNLFDYEIEYTKYAKHAFKIAQNRKNEFDGVIAIGGDGTVNEVGAALVDSNTALGIIPTGSGNGLARHLNIPLKIPEAIKKINAFKPIIIDTGLVNNKTFIGTCGFGFDAFIAKKFDEFHQRGFLAYAWLVQREFPTYKPNTFIISFKDKIIKKDAFMYSIANSSQFGNGFTISPQSELNDGKFEHVFLDDFNWYNSPALLGRFFTKKIQESPFFHELKSSKSCHIKIPNLKKVYYHIDGEAMVGGNEFDVKVKAASLKVIR